MHHEPMPDARSADAALGNRIMKVNHAGEHGAVHIYAGQLVLARFTAPSMVAELAEFKAHEEAHRAIFAQELRVRGQARCRSHWLCALGGYVLGLITGLLGRHAMSATTVAVERVVLRHLEHQLSVLAGRDEAAVRAISSIVADERLHHDRAAAGSKGSRAWSWLLAPAVAASTESVIWLGMHL